MNNSRIQRDMSRSPVLFSSSLNESLHTPADCEASPLETPFSGSGVPSGRADICVSPILMTSDQVEALNPAVEMVSVLNETLLSQDVAKNAPNFVSAAGKKVQPSQSSIAKIKGLLADIFDEQESCFAESNYGLSHACEDEVHTKVPEGSQGCSGYDGTEEPKLDLGGIRVDGVAVHNDLKAQNVKESTKTPSFKSAGGKNVVPSSQSLIRMKALFAELCDDGVVAEKVDQANSDSTINRKDIPEPNNSPDRSRSPLLVNGSFVAMEDDELGVEKPNLSTPVTKGAKALGSLEWEEFPDLKSSQADRLEAGVSNANVKENVSRLANKNPMVETHLSWKREDAKLSRVKPANIDRRPQARRHELPVLPAATVEDEILGKRKTPDSLEGHGKKVRHTLDFTVNLKGDSNTAANVQGILHSRRHLRDRQKALIQAKRNSKVASSPGILSAKKGTPSRLKLKDLDNQLKMIDPSDTAETRIKQCVMGISSENAVHFRFRESGKIVDGNMVADSCLLVYSDDGSAGVDEVASAFLTCPNVDPKLVPDGWVKNHYRWIVWKLAAFERTFPQHFSGRCLTLETVLLQLKYRYDREIDLVERSAFKKILEGDAAPSKFICCIASVKQNNLDEGESLLEFELTDGWYSVWSIVDTEMVTLYNKEVVSVGTKLIVHGAEITNCDQGCDPLNVPACVKAKISTNSVRRAKWFAKMGFASNNTPIPSLLCSVLPNGGLIGHLTAVVVRKYPVIYMCKDADGKTVFRSERSQAIYQEQQEKTKSDKAEQIYDQVWKEVESKYQHSKLQKKYSAKEITNLSDPEVLFSIVDGADGEFIQSQLSAEQLRIVLNYKNDVMAKMKNEVQKALHDKLSVPESFPASKVTKLLKVRLMDLFTEKHSLLTIWRPSDDDLSILKENKAFEFYRLMASGTRDKVLQMSSHRQTTYEPNDVVEPSSDFERTLSPLSAFEQPGFTPHFGEVDTVGVVVLVKLPEQTRGVTVVYLSDLDGHYLSITFWTSLSVFGCEDLMTEGSLVACSNLQWRSVSNHRKIPSVFASEITSFSLNPKQQHLRLGISQMKTKLFDKDITEMVASARSFVVQSMKLRDFSASPSPGTPKSSTPKSSTPAAQKLKILRLYDEAPISPLPPLTVNTRHVFQNFKTPCTTPQRRNLT